MRGAPLAARNSQRVARFYGKIHKIQTAIAKRAVFQQPGSVAGTGWRIADSGFYELYYTIFDGTDYSTISTQFDIRNLPPTITSSHTDMVVTAGEAFNLGATAVDPGASDIVSYQWEAYRKDGTSGPEFFTGQNVSASLATPGEYWASIDATDNEGARSSKKFSITVVAAPPPPVGVPDGTSSGASLGLGLSLLIICRRQFHRS